MIYVFWPLRVPRLKGHLQQNTNISSLSSQQNSGIELTNVPNQNNQTPAESKPEASSHIQRQ